MIIMARSIARIAAAVLLLSANVGGTEPITTTPAPLAANRAPCAKFTVDTNYISQSLIMDLEVATVPLRVPEQFFEDIWDRKNGFAVTSQLFRVEIGTFLPVSRSETGRRNRQDIWNWMTFVIGDRLPLEELAVLSAESFSGVTGGNLARKVDGYPRLSGLFGLAEILSDAPQPAAPFRTNTYLAESAEGGLAAVLSCNAPDSVAHPVCLHWFRAAGMDVKLEYRRTELADWQALQGDVTAFLDCAISAPL